MRNLRSTCPSCKRHAVLWGCRGNFSVAVATEGPRGPRAELRKSFTSCTHLGIQLSAGRLSHDGGTPSTVTGYRCVPRVRARASGRVIPIQRICARAKLAIYLQRACECRVQSSGKTKTAAVLAINEVNMPQPAIINQPSSTGRKERKAKERKLR